MCGDTTQRYYCLYANFSPYCRKRHCDELFLLAFGRCLLALGRFLLATGRFLLATGRFLLA